MDPKPTVEIWQRIDAEVFGRNTVAGKGRWLLEDEVDRIST
jgi:hypothetical protein